MSGVATCLVCGCSRDMDRERRAADLETEFRRQLAALVRQNDRLRALADRGAALDKARRDGAVEALAPILALHQPFGIYDDCDHRHAEDDERIDCGDFLACPASLMYRVCTECCTGNGNEQTEDCADYHEHTKDGPVCPTARAAALAEQGDG